MDKKNILIVIPSLRMGGAEKSLVSLLKSLDSNKIKVDLQLFELNGVLQKEIPKWVNILPVDPILTAMNFELKKYWRNFFYKKKFISLIIRIIAGIIHKIFIKLKMPMSFWHFIKYCIPKLDKSYEIAIGYLEGAADLYVLDKVNSSAKIGWIHLDFSKVKRSIQELNEYKRFDTIITISDKCKEIFCKETNISREKVHIVENISNYSDIIQKSKVIFNENWNNKYKHIVSVGRLSYPKGFDIAIESCKELINRHINIVWHVLGDGEKRNELEEKIKKYKLDQNFILEGMKENPYPYIRNADLFVQTSRFEGKSIAIDEAKILKKTILITNYPSSSDQINSGVNGIICNLDYKSIADSIEMLLNNLLLCQKLSNNCEKDIRKEKEIIEKFYKIINVI